MLSVAIIKNKFHKLYVILKTKLVIIKTLTLPIYFDIIYKFEIIYIYCICIVETLDYYCASLPKFAFSYVTLAA